MPIRALGEGVGVCESFGLRAPELLVGIPIKLTA